MSCAEMPKKHVPAPPRPFHDRGAHALHDSPRLDRGSSSASGDCRRRGLGLYYLGIPENDASARHSVSGGAVAGAARRKLQARLNMRQPQPVAQTRALPDLPCTDYTSKSNPVNVSPQSS